MIENRGMQKAFHILYTEGMKNFVGNWMLAIIWHLTPGLWGHSTRGCDKWRTVTSNVINIWIKVFLSECDEGGNDYGI